MVEFCRGLMQEKREAGFLELEQIYKVSTSTFDYDRNCIREQYWVIPEIVHDNTLKNIVFGEGYSESERKFYKLLRKLRNAAIFIVQSKFSYSRPDSRQLMICNTLSLLTLHHGPG